MSHKLRDLILAAAAILASSSLYANGAPTDTKADTHAITQSSEISKEDIARASQAFGHFIGRNLKTPALQFDVEGIITGIREGAAGKPAPMPDKEYEQLMTKIQEHALQGMAKDNLTAANQFLSKNAKEAGVVVVESEKLHYKILKEGSGDLVGPQSSPKINYTGKFLDGTVFGSSEEAGGPVTIPLAQTIPGFSLGIAGMKEGEKRRLFVHPDLGYGTSGQLPPNSLLIFDIEVLKADTPKQADSDEDDDDDHDDLDL